MFKRIMVYLIVMGVTVFNYFMYEDTIVKQLLGAEIIFFFVSIIYLILMRRNIRADLVPISEVAEKNKSVTIRVKVKNKSKFFSSNVTAFVSIENIANGKKKIIEIKIPAISDSEKTGKKKVEMFQTGIYKITLLRVECNDVINLLSIKKKVNKSNELVVMPQMKLLMTDVTLRTQMFEGDAEEYSDRESGDDPTEIYQIREYTESDSVHDIHWKLSAKSDEILVKERAKPEGCPVVVWIDYNRKESRHRNYEMTMDLIASVLLSIKEKGINHLVLWYDNDLNEVVKKKVCKDENVYEALRRMMYIRPYRDLEAVKVLKDEILKRIEYSTLININFDCEMKLNEERVNIAKEGKQIKWKEIYLEL
ncbi:MAG: DUF58 domain-containing protein [Lachnospiraceae bacterium]|nr:DUF58 domain-containing protein [Lachnospiraceae bacterium]